MPHTTQALPPYSPAAALPDTQSVLEELGALYPVVAYWPTEEPDSSATDAAEGQLDEEALDETIFHCLVALH